VRFRSALVERCRAARRISRVVTALVDDEKDAVSLPDAIGRKQDTTIVNRPGLTKVLRYSRKLEAKAAADRFDRWVRLLLRLAHLDADKFTVEPNHILRIVQQPVRDRVSCGRKFRVAY